MRKIELVICYGDRTWTERIIEIPEEVYAEHSSEAVNAWLLKNQPTAYFGVFSAVYNWMEDEAPTE